MPEDYSEFPVPEQTVLLTNGSGNSPCLLQSAQYYAQYCANPTNTGMIQSASIARYFDPQDSYFLKWPINRRSSKMLKTIADFCLRVPLPYQFLEFFRIVFIQEEKTREHIFRGIAPEMIRWTEIMDAARTLPPPADYARANPGSIRVIVILRSSRLEQFAAISPAAAPTPTALATREVGFDLVLTHPSYYSWSWNGVLLDFLYD